MAGSLIIAILLLTAFSLAVQMAEGATFAVVPFINKKAIGSISGIVGAGGNVGAFFAALFLKIKSVAAEEAAIAANEGRNNEIVEAARASASSAAISDAFLWIGFSILAAGLISLAIRFSKEDEKEAALELRHQNA
jgi:NNP family nitrate/nitrite transporter-like MFS transporter